MKILVTGGAGFIGSHLVDVLVEYYEKVTIIDNLSTGSVKNLNQRAAFYKLDINSEIIEEIFKAGVDVAVHLAAQVSVPVSLKNPLKDARDNITGSLNLIELAKKHYVKKFIYINSAAIFGNPRYLPIDEEHVKEPETNYGISKNVVEQYLKLSGLNYISLRLANVYGPRQMPYNEGGVISIFINNLLNNKPAMIEGDGNQTRDFIFVKDVVKAILCSLDSGERGCFNIGSGKKISINELFWYLLKLTGSSQKPCYGKKREGDIQHSLFKIDKARKKLEWWPEVNLKEGLLETINYEQTKQLSSIQ